MSAEWPRWEVFVRTRRGLAHQHAGTVHAADGDTALRAARDLFTRRQEGVSLWVVPSSEIVASDPAREAELFEPVGCVRIHIIICLVDVCRKWAIIILIRNCVIIVIIIAQIP